MQPHLKKNEKELKAAKIQGDAADTRVGRLTLAVDVDSTTFCFAKNALHLQQ
jgi:hypothetical protein